MKRPLVIYQDEGFVRFGYGWRGFLLLRNPAFGRATLRYWKHRRGTRHVIPEGYMPMLLPRHGHATRS